MGIAKQQQLKDQEEYFSCPDCGMEFTCDDDLYHEDGVLYCPECHHYFGEKGDRDERPKVRIV